MTGDSAAVAAVASGDQCARLEALRPRLTGVRVEGFIGHEAVLPAGWHALDAWREAQAAEALATELADADECNIIYSSGTTGLPKASSTRTGGGSTGRTTSPWRCAITARTHAVLTRAVLEHQLGGFPLHYAGGGTVVVMRAFEPRALLETVQRERITHGAMVPLQFQRILELPDFDHYDVSSLRSLMCCGSPLTPTLKAETIRRLGCELIELYGLTEGLITTLAPEDVERKLASVGKPLPARTCACSDPTTARSGRGRRVRSSAVAGS